MNAGPPTVSPSRSRSSIRPSATSPATPRRCAARARPRPGQGADLVIVSGAVHRGLSARGPRAQAGVPGGLPRRGRGAGARDATSGPAVLVGTPWVEDGKLYNAYLLLEGGKIAAVRYKVDLPNYGVFDEKRVFAPGPMPGPIAAQGRAHRHSDLRGHLGRRRGRVPARDRRRNPAGAERLALLARQDGRAAQHRGRARGRERPAAGLSQHGRRAGRARVRRRLVRAECRPLDRVPASGLPRDAGRHRSGCARTAHGAALRRWTSRSRRTTRPTTRPACSACATTSTRTASRAWCSASPAASTRRSAPRWRSMRSGRSACAP